MQLNTTAIDDVGAAIAGFNPLVEGARIDEVECCVAAKDFIHTCINSGLYFYVKTHNAIESMSRVRAPMVSRSAKCPLLGVHTGDAGHTRAIHLCKYVCKHVKSNICI